MRGVNTDRVSCMSGEPTSHKSTAQLTCMILTLSNIYMALTRDLFTGRWLGIKSPRN